MKLLSILFSAFIISLVCTKLIQGNWNFLFSGNMAMSVFMITTGLAHFKIQKGMTMMMPQNIPYKTELVYITGVLEIASAIGLMIPGLRKVTGVLLIIFLLCVLPANYVAATKRVSLYKADYTGPGMEYFYYQRLPMQLILISWIFYFSIYLC